MPAFLIIPIALALSQATAPTLAERCPSGFAEPDIYQYLRSDPDTASYPSGALRHEMEGSATIELLIGCDGVVKQCAVLVSSGHRVLDEHACQTMARVAFQPPRNVDGHPHEVVYTTSKTYSLR